MRSNNYIWLTNEEIPNDQRLELHYLEKKTSFIFSFFLMNRKHFPYSVINSHHCSFTGMKLQLNSVSFSHSPIFLHWEAMNKIQCILSKEISPKTFTTFAISANCSRDVCVCGLWQSSMGSQSKFDMLAC